MYEKEHSSYGLLLTNQPGLVADGLHQFSVFVSLIYVKFGLVLKIFVFGMKYTPKVSFCLCILCTAAFFSSEYPSYNATNTEPVRVLAHH